MRWRPTLLLVPAVVVLSSCDGEGSVVVEGVLHTLVVDGHPVAVWEKRPEVPVGSILLVHGRTWSGVPDFDLQVEGERLSLMDRLAAVGYAVYAQDLRGYGATPRDSTGWATPDRSVEDVAAALPWVRERSGVSTPPALCGWSFGTLVSHLTAQRHPDLISSLMLYGHPFDPDRAPEVGPDPVSPARRRNTAEAAASDFITPGTISDRAIQTYVAAALEADSIRVDWRRLHEFAALDPGEILTPTLVVHGEFDPFAPSESLAKTFIRLGTSDRRWVTLADGDHAVHLEHPGRFVREMLGFLERMP